MKKGIIILIIIWILTISGIVLYSKTLKKNPKQEEIVESETKPLSEYESIDYTGLYDENDLKIENLHLDEEKNFSYIKISGLKDKKIEKNINDKLYNLTNSLYNKEYNYAYLTTKMNAFNILSVYLHAYNKTDKQQVFKTLNIDLTTGKEIMLDDIINDKNMTRPIAKAYYNTAAFRIAAEKKYRSRIIEEYNYCIKNNYSGCAEMNIEEANNAIKKYDEYLSNLEEESLTYARNYDKNTPFYITSAGIIVPDINIIDISSIDDISIFTKDNPKLFNFYYKYKTDESIYDGTYQGRKNIMLSEIDISDYQNPYMQIIDDYAIIHYDYYDLKNQSMQTLNNYLERLDRNKFSFIYDISLDDKYVALNHCTMTKEIYNNEVKKEYAEGMLKRWNTEGHYTLKNPNISCQIKTIYNANSNVEILDAENPNENVYNYKKIIIINNKQKENEINKEIKNELDKLSKEYSSIGFMIESVTENKIFVKMNLFTGVPGKAETKNLTFNL